MDNETHTLFKHTQRGDYAAHPRLHRGRLSRGLIEEAEPKMREGEDRTAAIRPLVFSLNSVPVCVI